MMDPMRQSDTSEDIEAVASEWAIRIQHAPLQDHERTQLEEWMAGDLRRRGALARAEAVLLLYRDGGSDKYRAPDLITVRNANAATSAPVLPSADEEIAHPSRRRFLLWGSSAVAASVMGLMATGLLRFGKAQAYTTTRGEVRLLPLPGGSRFTLNTSSEARVWREAEGQCRVELLRGEALFDIAGGRGPRFLVLANDVCISASATDFVLRSHADASVDVVVQTGSVQIEPHADRPDSRQFSENTRIVLRRNAIVQVATLTPEEISGELAWRDGMLVFEDQPLSDVAREFARYSDTRILFALPEIGQETVTGRFAFNDPEGFARSAASSLGLKVDRQGDNIIIER